MTRHKLTKKIAMEFAKFIVDGEYGKEKEVEGFIMKKDVRLEDLGFTYRDGRYYEFDYTTGVGKRVSLTYILDILTESIYEEPTSVWDIRRAKAS